MRLAVTQYDPFLSIPRDISQSIIVISIWLYLAVVVVHQIPNTDTLQRCVSNPFTPLTERPAIACSERNYSPPGSLAFLQIQFSRGSQIPLLSPASQTLGIVLCFGVGRRAISAHWQAKSSRNCWHWLLVRNLIYFSHPENIEPF